MLSETNHVERSIPEPNYIRNTFPGKNQTNTENNHSSTVVLKKMK